MWSDLYQRSSSRACGQDPHTGQPAAAATLGKSLALPTHRERLLYSHDVHPQVYFFKRLIFKR